MDKENTMPNEEAAGKLTSWKDGKCTKCDMLIVANGELVKKLKKSSRPGGNSDANSTKCSTSRANSSRLAKKYDM
jgi:hypothetical protein